MIDLHGLTHFKLHLRSLEILGISDPALDIGNLVVRRWLRLVTTHKPDGSGGILDEIHRLRNNLVLVIPQVHMDEHVPGEQFLHRNFLLAPANIHHLFLGHEHLFDVRAHLLHIDPLIDAVEHLLLLAGEGMNDVPSVCHLSSN